MPEKDSMLTYYNCVTPHFFILFVYLFIKSKKRKISILKEHQMKHNLYTPRVGILLCSRISSGSIIMS